jgi:hypothetical protein
MKVGITLAIAVPLTAAATYFVMKKRLVLHFNEISDLIDARIQKIL